MTGDSPGTKGEEGAPARVPTRFLRVDAACDRYEAAWRGGHGPHIEQIVGVAPESQRASLLRELVALDLELRRERGERPDPRDYRDRFPGHSDLIDDAFGSTGEYTADHPAARTTVLGATEGGDEFRTPENPAGAGSSRARFRVVRPHAEGGLGMVFVAKDTELNREVALKEIRAEHADSLDSQARFLIEAEITGRLEHPGIVPVYSLGRHEDDRPFYAMRLIRGHNLKEAIERFHRADSDPGRDPGARSLELRDLLLRFVGVCNGVAYAHSRGVLHRDLKPSNVMLGPYGETLVVDWGLAKVVGGEISADRVAEPFRAPDGAGGTLMGSVIGTPAYMSPEQAAGDIDGLGPASDVYSLGATLYHLLTGRSPFAGSDISEILSRVGHGDFPPPQQVNPRVPPALAAVCLKAMARESGDRYESAEALKADLERWLGDEPVTAWRESLAIRARRWARRNRAAVVGVATGMVAGVLGLLAVAVVQSRAKSALEEKNVQLIAANVATTAAKDQAETALAETTRAKRETEAALEQKAAALARSEESRQRAEAVLTFLKDDVLAATRPEGQDGGLGWDVTVRKAVDHAEPKIARTFKDQPIVEADLRDTLGTTYSYLGKPPLAIRQFERALELRRAKLGPRDPDTLVVSGNLATAYLDAGRIDDAIKLHEQTLAVREEMLGPEHPATLISRNGLASAYFDAGRIDDAIKLDVRTLALREAQFGPDHPSTLVSRNALAIAYHAAGRNDEAIKLHERTLERNEAQFGPDHTNTIVQRNNLANAYQSAGRLGEAIKLHKRSLALSESKLGPDHVGTLLNRNNLGESYRIAGRTDDAIKLLTEALGQSGSKLGPDHPTTLMSRNNLAIAYYDAGLFARSVELHEVNLKFLESKVSPDHPFTLKSRNNLAQSYRAAGRMPEAIDLYEPTLKMFDRKLGEVHADTLMIRNNLSLAYETLGRWADAEALRRDTVARRRRVEKPDSPMLAGDLALFGSNLLNQRKWSDAEPVLRECLAIRAKAMPGHWARFNTMSQIGEALLGQARYTEAEPMVVSGYEGMKAREAMIPPPGRLRLPEAAVRVVRLYEAWGKPARAVEWKAKLGLHDLPADVFAVP